MRMQRRVWSRKSMLQTTIYGFYITWLLGLGRMKLRLQYQPSNKSSNSNYEDGQWPHVTAIA